MPELPDITVYIEALEKRTVGRRLEQVRVTHPFLVRSVNPPLSETHGKIVTGITASANGSSWRSRMISFSSCI